MNKSTIRIVTALFTIALATNTFAGRDKGKKNRVPGDTVSAVADGSVTVTSKSQGDQTFKTTGDTKVTKADGSAGTVSDIAVGSTVKVTAGSTPDTAAEVTLIEQKKKKGAAGEAGNKDGEEGEPTPTDPGKNSGETVKEAASTPTLRDRKIEGKEKRAIHLAEKGANSEFLRSPQGIGFKTQLTSTDDEINSVYEKYLNICRIDPATEEGKKMRDERDAQVQLLLQKREKIEAGYEDLKKTSPVYRAMLEKKLKSEMDQVKWKTKEPPPGASEESEESEEDDSRN